MGLILDSSVLIAVERIGLNAYHAIAQITERAPGEEPALSAVTVAELAHGIARSDSPQRKSMRRQFLSELIAALPVHPVTSAIALRAGLMDGESTARGTRIPFADLLIGVTALELGYPVATINLRHFRLIPGLEIIPC